MALGQKMLEFLLARSERDGERAFAYLGQQRELRPSNAIGEFTWCGCVPIIFYYTKIGRQKDWSIGERRFRECKVVVARL